MNDILDNEQTQNKEDKEKLTSNIYTKGMIYLLIMAAGNLIYLKITGGLKATLSNFLLGTLELLILFTIIGFLITIVRFYWRKRKERLMKQKPLHDPFWYQMLENSFSIWLIIMAVIIIGSFV